MKKIIAICAALFITGGIIAQESSYISDSGAKPEIKSVLNYDKNLIGNLPRAVFQGRIEVVVNENAAKRAVKHLMKSPVLGFDTETRPTFSPQQPRYGVALLQLSGPDKCFLFRINKRRYFIC